MQSPAKAQTATHFILALRNQKAGVIAGAGVSGFGWRHQPNMALKRDARPAGFGLCRRRAGRPLALRSANQG